MFKKIVLIGVFFFGMLPFSVPASAAPLSVLKTGDHCVAYKAKKTLFLITKTEVVGRSCSISAQVTPGLEGKYAIEVRVEHNTFEIGEKKRDEDVSRILGGNENLYVTFRSDMKTAPDWNLLIMQEKFQIPGVLIVNGREVSVTAEAAKASTPEGYEIDGIVKTNFKDLNIAAPEMVAGLFAKVQNDVELHFHLKADRTLGASSILSPPP